MWTARPKHLCVIGAFLGLFAPVGWAIVRFIFLSDQNAASLYAIIRNIFLSREGIVLYCYMGGGTALVLGSSAYLIGKGFQKLRERADTLVEVNRSVVEQKEDYEQRLAHLVENMKSFHAANANIQKSMDSREVARLAADSLCDILNFDRVMILMTNKERSSIEFLASRGSGDDDVEGISVPYDERAGIIYKTIAENRVFKIDDFRDVPEDYYVKPPYDKITQFRSTRFILCPFTVNGQPLGLFGVDNKVKKSDLDETDVETVRLFASQLSAALSRIELFDEVEKLTRALQQTFQGLIDSRGKYLSSLSSVKTSSASMAQEVNNLSGAAETSRALVSDTSSAVIEIATAVRQVTTSLDQIRAFTEQSISAVNEIHSTAQEVSTNSDLSYEMASKVKDEAEKGEQEVATGSLEMEEVSRAMSTTVGDLSLLVKDVDQIDEILSVIEEVNQRTRLLSLNASIVAAQAGVAGRPFAVVAEEIGLLSSETGRSATEIEALLKRIKDSTTNVVSQIGETSGLVEKSVQRGKSTNQRLDQILASAEHSMAMAQSIRQATQEQMKSTQSVSESIMGLGEMVIQTSKASQEQDLGLQRISQAVEEINHMTGEMAEATSRHQQDVVEIDAAVEGVGSMIKDLFVDTEKRSKQNQGVFIQLEKLRGVGE